MYLRWVDGLSTGAGMLLEKGLAIPSHPPYTIRVADFSQFRYLTSVQPARPTSRILPQ